MKLFKRKTAIFQDYINFTGIILFIWVIASKTVVIGDVTEVFVIDNALILVCLGILLEMLLVNASFFITDFKNYLFDKSQEKKYGKRKKHDEKEES